MPSLPAIGTTCKYTFTQEFASLNGIYTLELTETFDSALGNGVDFVASLYTPAGLGQTEYNTDWQTYQNSVVGKLVSITNPNVTIYVPEPVLLLVPDPTVKQYQNMYIGITLGYFSQEDATKISWILDQLNQLTHSITGTTNSAHIFTSGSTWMTDADYQALVTARNANIQAVETYYSALQTALAQIDSLKTIINTYEAGLIALSVNGQNPDPGAGGSQSQ